MTGPDNGQPGARSISVAELLAKNGTIGAPPVGGRRRRRRGNSDAVTVAELTGEIPIIRTGELPVVTETDSAPEAQEAPVEEPVTEAVRAEAPAVDEVATSTDADEVAAEPEPEPVLEPEPEPEPLQRTSEPLPRRGPVTAPERSHYPRPTRRRDRSAPERRPRGVGAELMSPDPIDLEDAEVELALTEDTLTEEAPDELGIGDASYLRSNAGALFGGDSVADDAARRGSRGTDDLVEEAEASDDLEAADELTDEEPLTRMQQVVRGGWIALQSILAVAFGGGLFIAFNQLWRWNSLVALVLGVLVILGLVVGVRIVRKTEDIGSTLTAVAVGALVTFGPLALLQAS